MKSFIKNIFIKSQNESSVSVTVNGVSVNIDSTQSTSSTGVQIFLQKKQQRANTRVPFTEKELCELTEKAHRVLPPKVKKYAAIIGVTYESITVKSVCSYWGKCFSDGRLYFNCLLMLCPDEVIDYLVIHELCHRKHMNHSGAYWRTVEEYCPKREEYDTWLNNIGREYLERLRLTKGR